MRYRWTPSKAQRAAYREKCLAIEKAKSIITNDEYDICCTGDCCTGDIIKFFNPAKSGEWLYGTIIKDSYGEAKQQHTFTIEMRKDMLEDKILIKGRNLYKNGVWRQKWDDENKRAEILKDKHQRGDIARKKRDYRKKIKEEEAMHFIPEWALTD